MEGASWFLTQTEALSTRVPGCSFVSSLESDTLASGRT